MEGCGRRVFSFIIIILVNNGSVLNYFKHREGSEVDWQYLIRHMPLDSHTEATV